MLFKPALGPDRRADFDPGKISNHGNAAKIAMLSSTRNDNDRDHIAVVVVSKQDLVENALDRLGSMLSLRHAHQDYARRPSRPVQQQRSVNRTSEAPTEQQGWSSISYQRRSSPVCPCGWGNAEFRD